MNITFNNYKEYLEVTDRLEKERITLETVELYNEMNSFISNNIVELSDSELYTEEAKAAKPGFFAKIWETIKELWNKIVEMFKTIMDTLKRIDENLDKQIKMVNEDINEDKPDEIDQWYQTLITTSKSDNDLKEFMDGCNEEGKFLNLDTTIEMKDRKSNKHIKSILKLKDKAIEKAHLLSDINKGLINGDYTKVISITKVMTLADFIMYEIEFIFKKHKIIDSNSGYYNISKKILSDEKIFFKGQMQDFINKLNSDLFISNKLKRKFFGFTWFVKPNEKDFKNAAISFNEAYTMAEESMKVLGYKKPNQDELTKDKMTKKYKISKENINKYINKFDKNSSTLIMSLSKLSFTIITKFVEHEKDSNGALKFLKLYNEKFGKNK